MAGHDNSAIMQSLENQLARPLTSTERVALVRCINKNTRPRRASSFDDDAGTRPNASDMPLRLPLVTLKHVRDTLKMIIEEQMHQMQPYLDIYTHCYSWCVQEILLHMRHDALFDFDDLVGDAENGRLIRCSNG